MYDQYFNYFSLGAVLKRLKHLDEVQSVPVFMQLDRLVFHSDTRVLDSELCLVTCAAARAGTLLL